LLGAHLLGKAAEAATDDEEIPEAAGIDERDRATVAAAPAAHVEHVPAGAMLGKDLDAKLGGETLDAHMIGANPLAAEVDRHAITKRRVEQPPADPVAGLEHDYLAAGIDKLARRGQPR
jgi:hypothetical protein